jgi:hypothetical protein
MRAERDRRPPRLFAPVAVALAALALAAVPAAAQSAAGDQAAASDNPPAATQEATPSPLPSLEDVDQLLGGEEQVLSGGAATYDPGDRRDPFKSLLVVTEQPALRGPRPEGIPGLLIDEVVVSGIFKTSHGFIAQVQAADRQKSYLIKVGDQLFDGDVVGINRNEVVFKQNVQDPTALKPFREVVKTLNPP